MGKVSLGQVLWFALQCAKDDRQSLIDAYHGDENETAVKQAMADIKSFEKLQIKFFGSSEDKIEKSLKGLKSKSIMKAIVEGKDFGEYFYEA